MSWRPPGPLGLGGAPLGNLFDAVGEEQARATIAAALDAGIRIFDTAPHYGHGLSERRMGDALRGHDVVVATKVGRLLEPDPEAPRAQFGYVGGLPFRQRFDYSADGVRRSLEDSLQRMGLARINIVWIHDVDETAHGQDWPDAFGQAMRGAARALSALRAQGVIRAWGLGVNRVEPCLRALEEADPDLFLLAGRWTLLDRSAAKLLDACAARGVGVVAAGAYNSGILATGPVPGATYDYAPATEAVMDAARRIAAVCDRFGVPLRAAALQFAAAHPAVCCVLAGARRPQEIADAAAMMAVPIPPELWLALAETTA